MMMNFSESPKARIKKTKRSTNIGVIVALHSFILDSMAQEVENKNIQVSAITSDSDL
jgi:DNA-binding LacI/PurR family transcriptional regulator